MIVLVLKKEGKRKKLKERCGFDVEASARRECQAKVFLETYIPSYIISWYGRLEGTSNPISGIRAAKPHIIILI